MTVAGPPVEVAAATVQAAPVEHLVTADHGNSATDSAIATAVLGC